SVIASAKSMGKLFGVLIFALLFNFFMYDFIQFTETTLSNKKIEAMQYVFQFAAGLSLVGLIFSFFFQIEKRK
ncbi:MAG: hypothetical protein Q8K02_09220, partial [Flavobacterium sp.]|nr:hypothetical protein [Flavobacterium sp.]